MPIYTYETIPSKPSQRARTFEIKQSMNDKPLQRDPKTGERVRRIITGGYGIMKSGGASSSCDFASSCASAGSPCCCSGACSH
ncbi:MAG: zinc ribbon domain-containing protein [bacterium]